MDFKRDVLHLDCEEESNRIAKFIHKKVFDSLRKKGIVIGLSGGVDSAVVAALSVRAIGKDRVIGLILPEKESNPISAEYANLLAKKLGIQCESVDITPMLESFDVYEKREVIIKKYFPEYSDSWKFRLVLPQTLLEKDRYNVSNLEVQDQNGQLHSRRLSLEDYHAMVAATDIKQRVRMIMLYYYAERHNYIVAGTTNVPEMLQGFFVKYGDGGVDMEPIAHLYKTQVFQLAKYLEVPDEIIQRTPSPDTYSLPVSDKEIYFCLPCDLLDLLLCAKEHNIERKKVSEALNLKEDQIERIYRDFDSKKRATEHLRKLPPNLLID
jgi:NAD+ synthase